MSDSLTAGLDIQGRGRQSSFLASLWHSRQKKVKGYEDCRSVCVSKGF